MDDTSPIKRRKVLKTTAGLVGVTAVSIPVAGNEHGSYYLEQGDQCWEVEPLSYQEEDVIRYYGFANAHAHPSTDILESDTSHLFLYEDPDGALSLVAVHDIPSHGDHGSEFDTGGGRVSFDFTGLPTGSWAVKDDAGDPFDSFAQTFAEWSWGEANTDGGAYRDIGSEFDITIEPTFNDDSLELRDPGEISFWCFLSGDAEDPNEVLLDMETSARVVNQAEPPCGEEVVSDLPDECVHDISIDIKPCSDPNAINPNNKGLIPVGIRGETDFDVTNIIVDSLRFGAIGHVEAEPAHEGHIEDTVPCEGDGIDDLVAHFPTEDTGFEEDDELGKLTGELQDGSAIIGFDSVKIVGGGQGNGGGPGGP